MEAKDFGDHDYFSDTAIGGSNLKCVLDLGNFCKRRFHFLYSITLHCQLETLLSMVIWDKQVENYKLFAGQEEMKRILRDIKHNLDDIVVRLTRVEHFIVSKSKIDSIEQQEVPAVINALAQNSPLSPITILDL